MSQKGQKTPVVSPSAAIPVGELMMSSVSDIHRSFKNTEDPRLKQRPQTQKDCCLYIMHTNTSVV